MAANPRVVRWLDGVDYTLDALARKLNMGPSTLRHRLDNGWTHERILATPCRPYAQDIRQRVRGKRSASASETLRVERALDEAVAREHAPPWERHPQPWD